MTVFSRRTMLRGAGVALALPWLESLAPRPARGQSAARRKRYISMFYPHGGVPSYYPAAPGVGDGWQLSSVLEPLAPVKSKMLFLAAFRIMRRGAATSNRRTATSARRSGRA
jgi:hypothetical protein